MTTLPRAHWEEDCSLLVLVVVRRLVQHKSQEDNVCQVVTAMLVMYMVYVKKQL